MDKYGGTATPPQDAILFSLETFFFWSLMDARIFSPVICNFQSDINLEISN